MPEKIEDLVKMLDVEIEIEDLDPFEHYKKHGLTYVFLDGNRSGFESFLQRHGVPASEYCFQQDGKGYIFIMRMPQ